LQGAGATAIISFGDGKFDEVGLLLRATRSETISIVGAKTNVESKSKCGHHGQYWDVWLGTHKQRLAAFTVLLMLALGIIGRSDNYQPYLNNESTSAWTFVGADGTGDYEQSHMHNEPNWVNSCSREIQMDSGATASNAKTGTLDLLAMLGKGINVVTNDVIGSALL
jgi:hypothetical protein